MKHYSASALSRLAVVAEPLLTGAELKSRIRAELDAPGGKTALAQRLGISRFRLSLLLRSECELPADIAERLGYRTVTRFERIGT